MGVSCWNTAEYKLNCTNFSETVMRLRCLLPSKIVLAVLYKLISKPIFHEQQMLSHSRFQEVSKKKSMFLLISFGIIKTCTYGQFPFPDLFGVTELHMSTMSTQVFLEHSRLLFLSVFCLFIRLEDRENGKEEEHNRAFHKFPNTATSK